MDALANYLEYLGKVRLECITRCGGLDPDAAETLERLWGTLEESKNQPVTLLFVDETTEEISYEEFTRDIPQREEGVRAFAEEHQRILKDIRSRAEG
jgi:hypothetical protein